MSELDVMTREEVEEFIRVKPEQVAALVRRYHYIVARRDERIAELERQNAAALAIVRAVAEAEVYEDSIGGMLVIDTPAEQITQARALLAGRQSDGA